MCATVAFRPGDMLFLYTDGVSEATDPSDVEFAEIRLEQSLQPFRVTPLADAVRQVINNVRGFSAGAPQADDITVLALRRSN